MGAPIGEIVAGAISGVGDLFKTGYDMWSNQRDFDYQKSLQNDVFSREDSAVQRRMKDLEVAGLNPNLAAGSAAGAGAVVGRSNTPSFSGNPIGSSLDAAAHVQQLRAQRIQNEILKNQKNLSDTETRTAELQSVFDRAALYNQLGIKNMKLFFRNGKPMLYSPNWNMNLDDSPLMQQLKWQWQNNKNSADLLQKDVDWYNTNQVIDAVRNTAGTFGTIGSGYYNFNRRR